jgi:hypothetical protein
MLSGIGSDLQSSIYMYAGGYQEITVISSNLAGVFT